MLQPTYLPFTEEQFRTHFARVKGANSHALTEQNHLKYYMQSIQAYNRFLDAHPKRQGLSLKDMKKCCQIEKDEMFWTASCLMNVFHSTTRIQELGVLLRRAYGEKPPIFGVDDWEDCLNGELHLFFETNLPSPKLYKKWLRQNRKQRQFIPYVLESDNGKKNLEGPTNVDAVLLNESNGFAVLIEAKVLSDISGQTTYDVMRNQMARNIDVMLEKNTTLCPPLNLRDPEKTLFLLLTPRVFKINQESRLYGVKFNTYKAQPAKLGQDLPHRGAADWEGIASRLGWLTWEDFREANKKCCAWLAQSSTGV